MQHDDDDYSIISCYKMTMIMMMIYCDSDTSRFTIVVFFLYLFSTFVRFLTLTAIIKVTTLTPRTSLYFSTCGSICRTYTISIGLTPEFLSTILMRTIRLVPLKSCFKLYSTCCTSSTAPKRPI